MDSYGGKIIGLLIIIAVFSAFQMFHLSLIRHDLSKIETVIAKEGGE